ncbi:hypothetical protein OEZ85_002856 [Tetradesmus obliquus]|uniref:lipoyl(octanoyl) transferase n=1 Tax=Tetradesmus obliquus TaxID=3088 RepID=A0ABY8U307_TETOB|nr:hypothetical protein OEZ85_002856 [Tetradesmus obliquus]
MTLSLNTRANGAGVRDGKCLTRRHRVSCAATQQPALLYDFHDQLVPYDQAWAWQKQRVAELCTAATADRRDTVFLLQHPPVYTLGAGSSEAHVKFDLQQPPHPLYRTERGGEVTYHGPGQLVMYPILDLTRHQQDLHWYLRGLEEVVVRALTDTSGLQGQRIEGLTGVWVDGHKLAAIGVRARKWVTYHGLALNVATALGPFSHITPCGIADRPVGSVKTALARAAAAAAADSEADGSSNSSSIQGTQQQQQLQQQQQQQQEEDLHAVSSDPLIVEYRYALLEALEEVFGLQLQPASQQQMQQLLNSGSSSSSSGVNSVLSRTGAVAVA